ncbi:MAG: hypothetical protein M3P53_03715 [Actinomycetota bacterium]|nr:hypothetical protein [Actinomycetota bacterium]
MALAAEEEVDLVVLGANLRQIEGRRSWGTWWKRSSRTATPRSWWLPPPRVPGWPRLVLERP